MSIPNRVKFHITESGPKRCVAVKACPKSPDDAHFESYREAAKAYEKDLAEANGIFATAVSKKLSYKALQIPQPDDIEKAELGVKGYFYDGKGPLSKDAGELHRELWFDNQIENVVAVAPEDLEQLVALRAQIAEKRANGALSTYSEVKELQLQVENIVANYRGRESYGPYKEFLDGHLSDSQEAQELIRKHATIFAKERIFSRALEYRTPVPSNVSYEFEKVWNGDAFTPGSRSAIEKGLRNIVDKQQALEASPNQEAYANKLGYPSFKQASFMLRSELGVLRSYHHFRGRNYPRTVRLVTRKLELFKD